MTLTGKHVVVTGGAGSIGSEICQQAVTVGAASLSIVSLTESGLYNIDRRLRPIAGATELRPVLGSVLDRGLMSVTLNGADVVIHAAAHKHVPICEANALAAIDNNVGGTYTLATVAAQQNVGQFVLISTDKAVRPASIMGATKRVAELVVRDAVSWTVADTVTRFITVRFGNVLDSAGSVVPLWREQIAVGGPVTLTDVACERFFMSIPNAVELVLGTLALEPRTGTFVFDMGPPRLLLDIAHEMIAASGRAIPIVTTGLRPGEKLTEELHYGGVVHSTANAKILHVDDPARPLACADLFNLLAAVRNRDAVRAVALLREMAA